MYLADKDILGQVKAGNITISDFDETRLQPASYDILLGNAFQIVRDETAAFVDPVKKIYPEMREVVVADGDEFVLHPGQTVLGVSKDNFGSDDFLVHLSGKSSLARVGLVVHNTAGIINPGHFLHITFELFNAGKIPIILRPGMEIAQILFSELTSKTERNYKDQGRFNDDNWNHFADKKE